MATHSRILAWRIPRTEEVGCSPWDHKGLDMTEQLNNNNYGNSMKFPQKIKTQTTNDPAIPLLDIYPKKTKTQIQKITGSHVGGFSVQTLNHHPYVLAEKHYTFLKDKNLPEIFIKYMEQGNIKFIGVAATRWGWVGGQSEEGNCN